MLYKKKKTPLKMNKKIPMTKKKVTKKLLKKMKNHKMSKNKTKKVNYIKSYRTTLLQPRKFTFSYKSFNFKLNFILDSKYKPKLVSSKKIYVFKNKNVGQCKTTKHRTICFSRKRCIKPYSYYKKRCARYLSQATVSTNTQQHSAPDGSLEDVTDSEKNTNTTSNATTANNTKVVCKELPREPTKPYWSRKPSSTSKNIKVKRIPELEIKHFYFTL